MITKKRAKKDIKRMVKGHLKKKSGWPSDKTFWLMREVLAEQGVELTPAEIRKIAKKA